MALFIYGNKASVHDKRRSCWTIWSACSPVSLSASTNQNSFISLGQAKELLDHLEGVLSNKLISV